MRTITLCFDKANRTYVCYKVLMMKGRLKPFRRPFKLANPPCYLALGAPTLTSFTSNTSVLLGPILSPIARSP